jgi:hypothetical protein
MLVKAIGVGFLIGFGATFLGISGSGGSGAGTQSAFLSPGSFETFGDRRLHLLREDCPAAPHVHSGEFQTEARPLA